MSWLYHISYNWKVWLMWFHKKTFGQVFHSYKHKCVEKKHFVEKLFSFERSQKLCWRPLYQNLFYMFIKTLDEIKEKCPQNNTKCSKKNYYFCLKHLPPYMYCVFSPSFNVIQTFYPFNWPNLSNWRQNIQHNLVIVGSKHGKVDHKSFL